MLGLCEPPPGACALAVTLPPASKTPDTASAPSATFRTPAPKSITFLFPVTIYFLVKDLACGRSSLRLRQTWELSPATDVFNAPIVGAEIQWPMSSPKMTMMFGPLAGGGGGASR
jgi:hypothetical protein